MSRLPLSLPHSGSFVPPAHGATGSTKAPAGSDSSGAFASFLASDDAKREADASANQAERARRDPSLLAALNPMLAPIVHDPLSVPSQGLDPGATESSGASAQVDAGFFASEMASSAAAGSAVLGGPSSLSGEMAPPWNGLAPGSIGTSAGNVGTSAIPDEGSASTDGESATMAGPGAMVDETGATTGGQGAIVGGQGASTGQIGATPVVSGAMFGQPSATTGQPGATTDAMSATPDQTRLRPDGIGATTDGMSARSAANGAAPADSPFMTDEGRGYSASRGVPAPSQSAASASPQSAATAGYGPRTTTPDTAPSAYAPIATSSLGATAASSPASSTAKLSRGAASGSGPRTTAPNERAGGPDVAQPSHARQVRAHAAAGASVDVGDGGADTQSAVSAGAPAVDAAALASPAPTTGPVAAKTMTGVSPPTATPADAQLVGARLREALASVANHAVLRNAATGEIDVPELGRIAVRAHNVSGAVDVDVTAEHADARAALRLHAGAMATDLREADVRVSRLTIEGSQGTLRSGDGTTPDGSGATSRGRQNDSHAHDSSTDGDDVGAPDPELPGASAGRVRIVL